ncbi:MAG: DoxX family membrane protein, partial [Saprospiraceae bacterium]
MKDVIDLIGRILISIIFLYEAYDSMFYFEETKEVMTSYGVTWNQDFLVISSIICLVLGGLLLLLG